jgi:hypothetical protein
MLLRNVYSCGAKPHGNLPARHPSITPISRRATRHAERYHTGDIA